MSFHTARVIFDRVQRGLLVGHFRFVPRADIPPASATRYASSTSTASPSITFGGDGAGSPKAKSKF